MGAEDSKLEAQARPGRRKLVWIGVLAAVALLVGVGAPLVWHAGGVKYRFCPKRWGVVDAGLVYRSGRLHPALVESTYRKYGIKTIVNLNAAGPEDKQDRPEAEAAKKLGVEVLYFPMGGDGTCKELEKYPAAVGAIAKSVKAGKPVQIHCSAGTQRTGGVVAVYRVLVEGKSGAEAYAEMCRYDFDPTDNTKLLPFLAKNLPYFARQLQADGVIAKIPSPLPVIGPAGK